MTTYLSSSQSTTPSTGRQCWICREGDEEETGGKWLQPCRCRGSSGWVHEFCLLAWINAQLARNAGSDVGPLVTPKDMKCPQCHSRYIVKEDYLIPRSVLSLIDAALRAKDVVVLAAACGTAVGSLWLVSWSFGAYVVTVTLGPEEARRLFMLLGAPLLSVMQCLLFRDGQNSIPYGRIEVFRSWWKLVMGVSLIPLTLLSQSFRLPFALHIPPAFLLDEYNGRLLNPSTTLMALPFVMRGYSDLRCRLFAALLKDRPQAQDLPISVMDLVREIDDEMEEDGNVIIAIDRTFISLFVMPAASSLLGWALFRRTKMSGLYRTLLGGAILTITADAGRLLYGYQAAYLKQSRRVSEDPARCHSTGLADVIA